MAKGFLGGFGWGALVTTCFLGYGMKQVLDEAAEEEKSLQKQAYVSGLLVNYMRRGMSYEEAKAEITKTNPHIKFGKARIKYAD